jgi:hypothetical protein
VAKAKTTDAKRGPPKVKTTTAKRAGKTKNDVEAKAVSFSWRRFSNL